VKVSYLRAGWTLAAGDRVTVGRSSGCTVQLPAGDKQISRWAAALELVNGAVLVTNTSASKPFVLRPPAGEDLLVAPGAAAAPALARFDILIAGANGDEAVRVDASALRPDRAADPATRSADTVTEPSHLTAAQHRLMVELCRPLLTASGAAARPATYAEIGSRLDLSPQYVRNVLKAIREKLSGYGIPGLISGEPNPNEDFRLALARWALWNGWVTGDDLGDTRGQ
jgi:hypothetical protein